MANFFIDRPIFAWVIAIVMMLAGSLAIKFLPVEQYPTVAPPQIEVRASYPGASAKAVEDSVTQIIEQQMNGVDNLLYMDSTSDSAGNAQIKLTFASGTDPDIAQVQVQNKLQLATPRLPQVVQQQGIKVSKASDTFLMVVAFTSTKGSKLTRSDLADYVGSNVQDPISRVQGVGQTQLFGSQYAMRVWINPHKLTEYGLTITDVMNAIKVQNNQITGGQIGGTPAAPGQRIAASIIVQTLLSTPDEFGDILLRVNQDGSKVRLHDVARVALGSENYSIEGRFNGNPAAGLGINLSTGANALKTAQRVRDKITDLEQFFPAGMHAVYAYDTTPFVRISIDEVVQTLIEAIILVFLVMYLFLQNLRATLIPTIAVPVVLLGTFGILFAFGYSINTLTMFGLVLAIGLLVDDAIVVVENVERVMVEEDLPPREATRRSMGQITGALVGIALVLSAVFIPMAFFPGSSGAIYRQFSITIVSAMVLSVLTALILTPALCATMLRKSDAQHEPKGFFGLFNRGFRRASDGYRGSVEKILGQRGRYLLIYLAVIGVLIFAFSRLPSAFLPDEDQGFLLAQVQLPVGSTQEQTIQVLKKMEHYYLVNEKKVVTSIFTAAGFSFAGRGQNSGIAFVQLKPWDQRDPGTDNAQKIAARSMGYFSRIREAIIYALSPPPIHSLGVASGFNFELQDRNGLGEEALAKARDTLIREANQDPMLSQVRFSGLPDAPQYKINIDHEKARAMGVPLESINNTLSVGWGSTYVNDFIDRGRVKRVFMQADAPYRMLPEDINNWYVRNNSGRMVPFSAFASGHWIYGPQQLQRYNGVSAMNIQGAAAPGYSTGEAMAEMEKLANKLPDGFGYQWTGLSYQEQQSGAQAPALYALSLLVVFLCLAALYESWSIPFSVMLVVPLGVVGAVLAATFRGLDNDIFFQVGLLTTIGLSAKNSILIVEFAKELEDHGMSLLRATLEAVRMRLRPILMTSLAFMLGVTPLMLSTGAGSGARTAIGTGVFGGMLTATALAIFFIPLFYVVVRRLSGVPLGDKDPSGW